MWLLLLLLLLLVLVRWRVVVAGVKVGAQVVATAGRNIVEIVLRIG